MAKIQTLSKEDRELGEALAEKAKLDPAVVLEDYDVQSHGDTISIHFEVVHTMPRAEFEALVSSIRPRG